VQDRRLVQNRRGEHPTAARIGEDKIVVPLPVRCLKEAVECTGNVVVQRDGALRAPRLRRRDFAEDVVSADPDFRGLRFHDLRHTCASLLIAQGAHPKVIQERLGHASITTTMNRYGHLFDGHDTELIEGLEAAHAAASPPDNVTALRVRGAGDS
jgi:site-specific recombinase XerC